MPQSDREIIKGYPSYSAWVLICGNFYSPERVSAGCKLLLAQEGTLTKDSYSSRFSFEKSGVMDCMLLVRCGA